MQRLIKDASKMTKEQKDLGVAVDGSSMSFDNVINAISVMQAHLGVAGTTSEEASKTLSGSFSAMKAAADNLFGSLALGQGVDEALQGLVTSAWTFFVGNLLPMVGTIFQSLINLGVKYVGRMPELITMLSEKILEGGPGVFASALTMIKNIGLAVTKAVPFILGAIMQLILYTAIALLKGAGKFLAAGAKWVWSLTSGIRGKISGVVSTVRKIPTDALNAVRGYISKFTDLGGDIVRGMISGVKNLVGNFGQAIKDMVRSGLHAGQKESKVGSPSKLFRDELGKWIALGAAVGVDDYAPTFGKSIRTMIDDGLEMGKLANATSLVDRTSVAGVADSVVDGMSMIAGGMNTNGGTVEVQAFLYPNGPSAGKAIVDLNKVWGNRVNG